VIPQRSEQPPWVATYRSRRRPVMRPCFPSACRKRSASWSGLRSRGLLSLRVAVGLAVNDRQISLAAEVTVDAPDVGHLEPMLEITLGQLARHGVSKQPKAGPRRRRLLAHRIDPGDRRSRDRGADLARRHDARGQTPRLGERPLRTHAPQAQKQARAQALPVTQDQRRTGLRGRSDTTGASTGSCEEAEPRRNRSGG
jgi:hypothetical protein